MKRILSVAAIHKGTVIDHIPAGHALKIIEFLKLDQHHKKVTVGMNLPSESLGHKDLIKIEERVITEKEAAQIAIFAPHAKINIIDDYQVVKKFRVQLPPIVQKLLKCPNSECITTIEPVESSFAIESIGRRVVLECRYCEKRFSHDAY